MSSLTKRIVTTTSLLPPPQLQRRELHFGTSVARMLPEHSKRNEGEDAFFLGQHAVGVADGVGGWSTVGIDSGLYSRGLMQHTKQYFDAHAVRKIATESPVEAMIAADALVKSAKIAGSTTFCVVSLHGDHLKSALVGDAGFMLLRSANRGALNSDACDSLDACRLPWNESNNSNNNNKNLHEWRVVYKSQEQMHAFNTPFQVGSPHSKTEAKHALSLTIPVRVGDLVVLGSDGLFDNLFVNDVAQLADEAFNTTSTTHPSYLGAPNASTSVRKTVEEAKSYGVCGLKQKRLVGKFAEEVLAAAFQASIHPTKKTPFALQASRAGFQYSGGKPDDITVVVGLISCEM